MPTIKSVRNVKPYTGPMPKPPRDALLLLRDLNDKLSRSQPKNDWQRGFHAALTLVRNDARRLVRNQPLSSWTDEGQPE